MRMRCGPKHRNSRRETAGWDRIDRQEVFALSWKAGPSLNVGFAKTGAGSVRTFPALLPARNDLMSRCSDAAADCQEKGEQIGHFPGFNALFETFGHERKPAAVHFLDLASQYDNSTAIASLLERNAAGRLRFDK